jgi:hypothetical protein
MTAPRHQRHHQPTPIARRHGHVAARHPAAPPLHDHHGFLRGLRRGALGAAVVGFGGFFGLTAINVVGVTAHAAVTGPGATSGAATDSAALPPGDFFGTPGVAVRGASGGQALTAAPPLVSGGGRATLSSGGS